MECSLTNFDRGIAPDDIKSFGQAPRFLYRIGRGNLDIVNLEDLSIVPGQLPGAFINIHGPDVGLWTAQSHSQRNWSGPTTQIEEGSSFWEVGSFHQQDFGSRIQASFGKDAGIGFDLKRKIGKLNADPLSLRRNPRLLVEIVGYVGLAHDIGSLSPMSYQIRTFGDPVLATQAGEVADINGKVVRIVDEMFETLYSSDSGIGLAAPQVGIQRQIFVWDMDDDPRVIINPKIVESDGEWVYDEGCLSIPGLYVEMTRPKTVLMTGLDLDGNEIAIEADELEARLFQHELDHLNGVLMFDRMQPDQRKRALEEYKRLAAQGTSLGEPLRLSAE